jgi:WD40 repeat protein
LTCEGPRLHVWDSRTLAEVSFSPLKLSGGIYTISFSPDGRTIVAGGNDFTARVWDASTGQALFSQPVQHAGQILDARISPDGRRFVTGGQDTVAQIWSTRTGQRVGPPLKHILHVKYLRFNPDGRRLLANSCDQAARVWDMATAEAPDPPRPALADERQVISPDGRYVLLQGESNLLWIVDTGSGRRLAALPHPNPVSYASFSRDGRSVITACEEVNAVSSMRNDIFLWETPTGRRLNMVPMAQTFRLLYVAFSPDSSRLLTCGFDYTARLWDAHTGQPLSPPLPHRQRIAWGAFSPDGHSVATVSWDKTARVWDAATGNPLTPPLQHKTTVAGAIWSADGKRLHTVTEDDYLQVWDLANGEPLTPTRKIQETEGSSASLPQATAMAVGGDLPRDERPVADLVLLAQMLAVGRIDSGGNVVPLQLDELTHLWLVLRQKYPEQFSATPAEVVAWHLHEADGSEAEGNLTAALFHLERAVAVRPQDPALLQQRSELAAALRQGQGARDRLKPYQGIPSRSPQAGAEQIDLSPHYNVKLHQPGGTDFGDFREGLQTLGGIRFDARGSVHLNGQIAKAAGSHLPERVRGINIGQKCRRLHFLQGTGWSAVKGTTVGSYVLHYADGQSRELPIIFGQDTSDWWRWGEPFAAQKPEDACPVWNGSNRQAAQTGCSLWLYKSTRENPRPDVELKSIDFVSSMSEAAPFMVALTVE